MIHLLWSWGWRFPKMSESLSLSLSLKVCISVLNTSTQVVKTVLFQSVLQTSRCSHLYILLKEGQVCPATFKSWFMLLSSQHRIKSFKLSEALSLPATGGRHPSSVLSLSAEVGHPVIRRHFHCGRPGRWAGSCCGRVGPGWRWCPGRCPAPTRTSSGWSCAPCCGVWYLHRGRAFHPQHPEHTIRCLCF